ncbi:Microtubule-associated protein 70-5 isoform 1 [Dorcoceras hygrometricum]|uniref:Microtubule-associated protein 70-5 isoform 1 n=1 Tax=Dorcoceras hygrometricum TaxID=472368 RepID=A0A2Z7CZU8_9LAMI|nr:Microtubule-associated protein 70-5 isoform 1 [Dorcoceras hygrometricum]
MVNTDISEKERDLGKAQSEIKALRATEIRKDKAVKELGSEVERLEEKLIINESLVQQKNLDIKKLTSEKREALAAQYAAEATLRRVYANQKDDDSVPIELVIAPLEAELKMRKNEVAALQEDKKAMERLARSKEAALLEAEKILKSALERALIVEEVQNQNFELRRQIEICLEENKVLEKTNRQKVFDIEKLSETIVELEGAILAGGATANTIRDYRRQISELNEEKRTLERELARAKVSANRVASVVANEWKDEKDKVMPVKQWIEERRVLQAEIQKLKDKLSISERTANAAAQVKDKLRLRLKTLEEGLRNVPGVLNKTESPKTVKTGNLFGILSSDDRTKKISTSLPRASAIGKGSVQTRDEEQASISTAEINQVNGLKKKYPSGERLLRKSLWASRNKIIDDNSEKENTKANSNVAYDQVTGNCEGIREMGNSTCMDYCCKTIKEMEVDNTEGEDMKLTKKTETLAKAIEVESRKIKRDAAVREKDPTPTKVDDKLRNPNPFKRVEAAYAREFMYMRSNSLIVPYFHMIRSMSAS